MQDRSAYQVDADEETDDAAFEDWVEDWWERTGKHLWAVLTVGREQARAEAREQARAEAREQARVEAREQGRAEGRVEAARDVVLAVGSDRFGPPDAETQAALEAIGELHQLRAMARRLFDASGWDEILRTR